MLVIIIFSCHAAFQIPAFGGYKIFGLTRGFLSQSSEVALTLNSSFLSFGG